MKVTDRNGARTFGALHVDRRLQCRHGHAHVRRVRSDSMFAGAKDGEGAVAAGDGRAAGPRFALVTGHSGVAEVHASGSLEQVASRCGHVTKLGRCTGKKGLRQYRIISLYRLMVREIG